MEKNGIKKVFSAIFRAGLENWFQGEINLLNFEKFM
jgi:hypothetical protein